MAREALEEADAKIEIGDFVGFHQDYFYHKKEKRFYQTLLLYFKAELISPLEKPKDQNVEFRDFVKLDDLDQYPTHDYIKSLINKAKK
ncbi:NUDIX hydrolase [Candidatus Beckwithbacteria bacterium]|nr:NUDIX hydrolase [Candidatus Beckwithbacteria bacterium]